MKRFILIAITCIVVDQMKSKTGWITECKGIEVNGEVIFAEKIMRGQTVTYEPFMGKDEDVLHGRIIGIDDTPHGEQVVELSSDTGKAPE